MNPASKFEKGHIKWLHESLIKDKKQLKQLLKLPRDARAKKQITRSRSHIEWQQKNLRHFKQVLRRRLIEQKIVKRKKRR
jgi:hypothetical protein